jgi:arsenite-transporting ATPase
VNDTEFVVVTVPEEMVLDETNRLLHELFALKIPVRRLIINRVVSGGKCPYCEHRGALQGPCLEKLLSKVSYEKVVIPLFSSEIRGVAKLKRMAAALDGRGGTMEETPQRVAASDFKDRLPLGDIDHADMLMIGGKGGVGKTTTSAATALLLAAKNEGRAYHLYSIDPAHSLGDCFKKSIGDKGVQVLKNLRVCELDADKLYLRFQEEYRSAVNALFDHFVGGSSSDRGMDLGYDRELLNELFQMAPPGLSELMALHQIISDVDSQPSSPKTCILFDTAPTGHFVRFMELPALVRTWLTAIFELLLKYKGVVRLGEVAKKLVALSKNIRAVVDLMADPKKTAVIVVTIPKAMAVVETERLLKMLDKFKIRCNDIVLNMATMAGGCDQCAAFAADEAPWIKSGTKLRRHAAVVPYLAENMGGVESLRTFGGLIWE